MRKEGSKRDASVVGIDVAKDKLDIAVRPRGEAFGTGRDAAGLDAAIAPLSPAAGALEATGGFETVVAARLAAAGPAVVGVNPARVRAFAKALGKHAKTDPIDAAVIAHFAAAAQPEIRPLPNEAAQYLADLTARRRQIIQMIGAERQRQRRLVAKRLQKSIARLIKALEKELSSRDQDIDDAVRGSPSWRETEDLPRCLASGQRLPERSSPNCLNLARLTARRSRRAPVLPVDAAIWQRQELHRRRQAFRAGGPVHG